MQNIFNTQFATGKRILSLVLLLTLMTSGFLFNSSHKYTMRKVAFAAEVITEDDDYVLYINYKKYLNYQKRSNYRKYKKYKKYAFDSAKKRLKYKDLAKKYDKYKDNPSKYPQYAKYKDEHKRYDDYEDKYVPYKKYKKYKAYDKKKYGRKVYANYGTNKHKAGYNRYVAKTKGASDANLGGGSYGPKITIGLHEYTKTALRDDSFRIYAYSAATGKDIAYAVKDEKGNKVATINAGETCKVKYDTDKKFRLYDCLPDNGEKIVDEEINFVAASSSDENNIVFDTNLPIANYDDYRGQMKLSYYDASGSDADRIWAINTLPLEQYVWGMGEITGTGDTDYNRVMTISYRTYGYWKIKYSTKYAAQGFKVNATPGNQLYYGYNHEVNYPRIKPAAVDTRGKIVMYKDRIAITPYSSWTDGRTRSWKERWGSDNYPWCKSVKDSYGKHPSLSTSKLVAAGNHMVGLSAHGALDRAAHGWGYEKILKYYYDGIVLKTPY